MKRTTETGTVGMNFETAVENARRYVEEGHGALDLSSSRETTTGWFFPAAGSEIGSSGIIVNKTTGKVFVLGSAFPVERDIRFYDRGYRHKTYDLVVVAVHDMDAAVEHLVALELSVVAPTYESGIVWRVPRELSGIEIRDRLIGGLPCVFASQGFYFRLEELERAEESGSFEFKAIPVEEPDRISN